MFSNTQDVMLKIQSAYSPMLPAVMEGLSTDLPYSNVDKGWADVKLGLLSILLLSPAFH